MTLLLHSSVFRHEGPPFAWSFLCLHIVGAWHRVIYLFDYCPASWHVLLIDGHCVPSAAGLLVSLAQNSLKDSSAGTLVTLFHFSGSPSLYHSFSVPLPPSISPVALFIILDSNLSCPLCLFLWLFCCIDSDLHMFNLNNRNGVLDFICAPLCMSASAIVWR